MIKLLSGSHESNQNGSVITVTTSYIASFYEFLQGYGNAYVNDILVNSNFILPQVGDSYVTYYNISDLVDPSSFWYDLVCANIQETKIGTFDFEYGQDFTSWERDRQSKIVYTWSSTGKKDIIRPDDPSSMRIKIYSEPQFNQIDIMRAYDITHTPWVLKSPELFKDWYFTAQNPTIYYYGTNEDGTPKERQTIGPYATASEQYKEWYRNNTDAPPLYYHDSDTICKVTVFSKSQWDEMLYSLKNSMNSVDFIRDTYNKRELSLLSKGRLPTSARNDLANINDANKWLFYNFEREEFSNSTYQYDLYFRYNPDGWNMYYGHALYLYKEYDFWADMLDYMNGIK